MPIVEARLKWLLTRLRQRQKADWDESAHPRADDGKFGDKLGGGRAGASEGRRNPQEQVDIYVPWNDEVVWQGTREEAEAFLASQEGVEDWQIRPVAGAGGEEPSDTSKPIHSPAFKDWFGDWEKDPANASKVVNASGEPQETYPTVLYHGSPAHGFTEFDADFMGSTSDAGYYGYGFYFTTDRQEAEAYSKKRGRQGGVYEVYLNLKNPFVWDTRTHEAAQKTFRKLRELGVETTMGGFVKNNHEFQEILKRNGHDGVMAWRSDRENLEAVAFKPNQIKSTDNEGSFDVSNNNIHKAPRDLPTLLKRLRARLKGDWRESDHPRADDGKFGEGTGSASGQGGSDNGGAAPGESEGVKLKSAKTRAFTGKPVPTKNKLSKQAAGALGESIIISYLKSLGMTDARAANTDRNNFPVDLVQDHELIEAKTGMVSNGPGAQQWRLTIGEPGKEEKAWLATASPEEKAAWNAKKQQAIHDRKAKVLEDAQKALGRTIKTAMMTLILNPDTRTVDLYRFEGFDHDRIGWNSEKAKAAYVGSYHYA